MPAFENSPDFEPFFEKDTDSIYGVFLGTLESPPVGSQHSFQPTAKLHILPLVWIFPLGKRSFGAQGQQLEFALSFAPSTQPATMQLKATG